MPHIFVSWPLTKLWMLYFRYNKFLAFMNAVVKASYSTTAAAPHSGVSRCVIQATYCDRILCGWERVRNTKNVLQCLWKCCRQQKHCWLRDKRMTVSETGKVVVHDLPCSGHHLWESAYHNSTVGTHSTNQQRKC